MADTDRRDTIKILVACGGAGRGLLGQLEALGFDAEVQIDAQRELIIRRSTRRSRAIAIDQGLLTQRYILDEVRKRYANHESRAKVHAEALYQYYPHKGGVLSKGLAQSPAIGGGAVQSTRNVDRLRNTFEGLVNEVGAALGPDVGLEVWIVSSAAGGTGAGIRRRVGQIIADVVADRQCVVNLHFLTFGAGSYGSIGSAITRLNTFFCVAADSAFAKLINSQYRNVAPNFYYLEIPDVGKGDEVRAIRENLAEVAAKAVLLDDLQHAIDWIIVNSPNRMLFVLVGFWGPDFDQDQILYETMRGLSVQLENLRNPDPDSLIMEERYEFYPSPELQTVVDDITPKMLLETGGVKFPRRPVRTSEQNLESYMGKMEDAVDVFLPQRSKIRDLAGSITIISRDETSRELMVREPSSDGGWIDEYEVITLANWVRAWCRFLLEKLEIERQEAAYNISSAANRPGGGARSKATDLARLVPDFLELTVMIRMLRLLQRRAGEQLKALLPRIHTVADAIQEEMSYFAESALQRFTKELIIGAELTSEVDRLNHRTWFEVVDRAIRTEKREAMQDAIRVGAVGLTRAGLASVLGLSEDVQDLVLIRDRILETLGGMNVRGKQQPGRWWQSWNIADEANPLLSYRIFPRLDQATRQGLGVGLKHGDVEFISTDVVAIGMHVLAVDLALIGRGTDAVRAPYNLLHPMVEVVKRQLNNNWPTAERPGVAEDNGLANIAKAAVVGDPLFLPVFRALDFTPDELNKLAYLFDFHDPDPGPIIPSVDAAGIDFSSEGGPDDGTSPDISFDPDDAYWPEAEPEDTEE
jgi:hypothetical protein